jgi:peptidyl-prolyl cis-trans isomerase A (cyclophilin A)
MRKTITLLCAAIFLAACSNTGRSPAEPAAPAPPTVEAAVSSLPSARSAALLSPEQATERAPEIYKARFSTTKGDFLLEVRRDWAPQGADRFYNLVKAGYFEDVAFFRAMEGFMVQFGLHGLPQVNAKWYAARIPDDPSVGQSNKRGLATFATAGPNTRTSQVFINLADNTVLDSMGFTPFGRVAEGMEVLDKLYKGYGDGPPQGTGPDQGRIHMEGNAYLKKEFPLLDYIKTARIAQ